MCLRPLRFLTLFFCLLIFGCQTPPVPPEVKKAERQELDLWRAGASVYSLEDYKAYKLELQRAEDKLGREKLKVGFFRNYESVRADFQRVLAEGEDLLKRVRDIKERKSGSVENQVATLERKVQILEEVTLAVNEKGAARKWLAEADVMISEVRLFNRQEKFDDIQGRIARIEMLVERSGQEVLAMLSRYRDPGQIAKWRKWAQETVEDSQRRGILAIVVYKLEHQLTVYKGGQAIGRYDVGLGSNGLSDKLYAGDDATPEGKYQVVLKIPASTFYKALLINYPNEENRKQFLQAKRRGELSPDAGIGGSIEIHGGGKDSLTKGCVSMENKDMDRLYDLVKVGTPVAIVGALDVESSIIRTIKSLGLKESSKRP